MHKPTIHLISPIKIIRLVCVVALAAGVLAPANPAFGIDERRLSFYHTHTRETLDVTYSVGGEYVASELDRINDFLSDFRTGDATVMDPQLLDVIYDGLAMLDSEETVEVISAYRSPATNEMLRSTTSGVYRFNPRTFEAEFHFSIRPNPHGDVFD